MQVNGVGAKAAAAAVLLLAGVSAILGQAGGDPLLAGFQNPPDSAKPRVWWHWMNGNITKDGIRADLEWMKRVGIGGFQNFDAALMTPQVVSKRLVYMTPEWKDAFRFTAQLADQLKLEMAIAGSPGWSESGGPWVKPGQAMKKFVWSETVVEGGRPFAGAVPRPPGVTGPFQNIAFASRGFGLTEPNTAPKPQYYADVAVVAFRLPESEVPVSQLTPAVTSSGGKFDLNQLTDGDVATAAALPMAPVGEKAWIQFEFAKPQTVRALTLVLPSSGGRSFGRPAGGSNQELEASGDGVRFRTVAVIPAAGMASKTVAFEPTTAKYFRMSFKTPPPAPAGGFGGFGGGRAPAAPTAHQISELVLHTGARVNRVEEKAAFAAANELYSAATPAAADSAAVTKSTVVDLTSKMRADGTLDWTPPAGKWMVLRLGYSLLGITNHPASPEATGLEVDKLNKAHVKSYEEQYLDQYQDTLGELMGKRGLQFMVLDSYEAGTQNWTDDMLAQFTKRRGYEPLPWLPVLTGHVVESAAASDRFLWDFRKTIGELIAENHYDEIGEILHARGLRRYTESHESGRAFIGDGMDAKKNADIPMSAMWTPRPGQESERYDADIRESASVAHIYGQNIVAAESLTAGTGAWSFSPETLKPTADRELAMGLNRFVIHTSVHQPVNDKVPGLGLGPFGQWFTRHETWAEQAKPWTTYLARSSYMLQQGKFVADIAYYYGEDSNVTALFSANPPAIPSGYNFDYVSSDVVLNKLTVNRGRLVTPSGMNYSLLYLDAHSRYMPLAVLRKIRDLVKAGAAVAGPKPLDTPSLSDDPAEFRAIVGELWGSGKVKEASVADALVSANSSPDFEYNKPQSNTNLMFVHRKLADGDVYWVDNRNDRAEALEATFRVQGKAPEFWYPQTGQTAPAPYTIAGGRTAVALHLDPHEAVFVVFRKAAATPSRAPLKITEQTLGAVEGAWDVAFQAGRGAPAKITLDRLASWSQSSDAGVKYFSGTATYTKTLQAANDWFGKGGHLWLDLGDVRNIAEVTVNGKPLGIVWKKPFRVDVTSVLKPGANQIVVKVTNLWVNRLIGDQQPGVEKKYTYTTQQFYRADSPLLPSGLIGPVQVIRK
ncbi:MAG: discoidin domain-containing protein [Acidobacteria bacterium]|nr:discoidin domain-containing protein [Acidobacteriota bacterium]